MEGLAAYVPMFITMGCVVAFIHIMRLGQHLKRNLAWIGAINYVVAEIASGVWWTMKAESEIGRWEIIYGILAGLLFVAAYFLIEACIRFTGVGVTQTFERLSACLIPVIATMAFWGEIPRTVIQWAGLALAVVSIPLLSHGGAQRPKVVRSGKILVLLLAMLLIPGAASVTFVAYERVRGPEPQPAFFTLVFLIAAVANVAAAGKSDKLGGMEILLGVILGAMNFLSNYFFYQAINAMKGYGYILFPSLAAGVILISLGVAALVWKERYRIRVLVGIMVAVIALVLVNVPPPEEKRMAAPQEQTPSSHPAAPGHESGEAD